MESPKLLTIGLCEGINTGSIRNDTIIFPMPQTECFPEIAKTVFVRHGIYVPRKGTPDIIMNLTRACKELWKKNETFRRIEIIDGIIIMLILITVDL